MRAAHFSFAILGTAFLLPSLSFAQLEPPAPSNQNSSKMDLAYPQIQEAIELLKKKDTEAAGKKLDEALQTNPNSTMAHVLRGSVYASELLWSQAEAQFTAAENSAPGNLRIKFFLADAKFSQKKLDEARALYAKLVKVPERGDLAAYMVFLCDLLAGHTAQSDKERAVFNDAMSDPSYYFSNVAWYLSKHDLKNGRDWLNSAARIYPLEKIEPYAQSLRTIGYLPIPETDPK